MLLQLFIKPEVVVIGGFVILSFLVVFIILFISLYQRRYYRYLREKQSLQTEFQNNLLQTQIEIQEQTLKNIAQEIHDNIGQVLSLAKLNLGTFAVIPDAATQTKVEDTKKLVSKALRDLRDLSRSMHGDKIAELGLVESISDELKILQNTGKFITRLQIEGEQYKLEPQKEMVIFRMVQEALHNAIKHSNARNINVQLNYDPGIFYLSVIDNGSGFDTATLKSIETGIGLKSMQNRATLIGAVFSIRSGDSNGTVITIELKQDRFALTSSPPHPYALAATKSNNIQE